MVKKGGRERKKEEKEERQQCRQNLIVVNLTGEQNYKSINLYKMHILCLERKVGKAYVVHNRTRYL